MLHEHTHADIASFMRGSSSRRKFQASHSRQVPPGNTLRTLM